MRIQHSEPHHVRVSTVWTDPNFSSEHNKSLRWTIDQLLLVSRKKLLHPATKDVDNSGAIFEVMQTLASAQLGTSELRQHAQSRVATILGDLVSSKSSVQEQGQVLVKATSIAKKRAAPSKALRSARKVVQATVNELDNSDEAQDAALRGLCQLIVFLTYSEDDSFAGLAEEVSDVVTSFKAAPMAVDAAEQEGGVAAEPTAVLVDYLLTLLRTTGSQPALQPVVRSVVESVFEVFIEVLGGQAIAIIKDVSVTLPDLSLSQANWLLSSNSFPAQMKMPNQGMHQGTKRRVRQRTRQIWTETTKWIPMLALIWVSISMPIPSSVPRSRQL